MPLKKNSAKTSNTMKDTMQRQQNHSQKPQQRTSSSSAVIASSKVSATSSTSRKMSDKGRAEQRQSKSSALGTAAAAASPLLLKECLLLLQTKQYKSCEMLTSYLVSSLESSSSSTTTSHHYAAALEVLGDCFAQMTPPQFRRALSYYRRSSLTWQHVSPDTTVLGDDASSSAELSLINVQLKTFHCLMALKLFKEAYGLLNTMLVNPLTKIPQELRTFELSMEFATLCMVIDLEKEARDWYLDALRLNPYALEAIEMLIILGADPDVLQHAIQIGLKHKNQLPADDNTDYIEPLLPMQDIIMAQFHATCNQNPTALAKYRALAERFPNNIHLLSKIALLEFNLGEYTKSDQTFTQIRQLDPDCMDHMDEYAELLRRKRAVVKLNQLSMDLLQINDSRPEAWVCLALYHQLKSGTISGEQSLSFVDRALRLSPRYAYAHYIRGMLLLLEHTPEEAVLSFHCANKIKKTLSHYEGLVEAYLMEEKYKEAVCMAKEAMAIAPKDPRTFTLIGLALSHSPATNRDGKEKAKRAFRKALLIDPNALRPMFALADIYMREKDFASCVELLTRAIEQQGNDQKEEQDMVHAKLADIFTAAENYTDALKHCHVALSMNPGNMVARRGLDRLEKLMRGVDPDVSGGANDDNSDDYDDEEIDDSTTGNFEADAGEMGYL